MSVAPNPHANRRVAFAMVGVVAVMVGMAYAAVPLYRIFCQVTGYGGTTGQAASAPTQIGDRVITVRFDANTAGTDMPWRFEPVVPSMSVRVGEEHLAFYRARNPSQIAITGTATFNVTPHLAGAYFRKIACFCFSEQRLEAGESVDMPVSFFVDPDIVNDPNLRELKTITLSYTFFKSKKEESGPITARVPASGAAPAPN
jgi:cytochrome c oxidase assembly protein subunit 11